MADWHYLDYAASAPLRPEALQAWVEADAEANPSSPHRPGRQARQVLDQAREAIASHLGAQPSEVIFTAGGTEANNLALAGMYYPRQTDRLRPYVVISAIEHPAVIAAAELLAARAGAEVRKIGVDQFGRLDLNQLADHLAADGDRTALISVMAANNESGTIEPLAAIVELAAAHGVPVHSDLVQVAGRIDFDFGASHLAAASISAHKLGGPVGVGALLAGRRTTLVPIMGGGGQERGVRSGTLDIRSASAMAAALTAASTKPDEATRLEQLLMPFDAFVARHPDALERRTPPDRNWHLPGLRLVTAPGCSADVLIYLLDRAKIAASAGAACHAGVAGPSHVLMAMGCDAAAAQAGIRLSLGWASTADDVTALVKAIPGVLEKARVANPVKAANAQANTQTKATTSIGRKIDDTVEPKQ